MEILVTTVQDFAGAAAALIDFAEAEKIFIFEGEMGAGKTTFIKQVCARLGVEEVVSSPTFSIVNEYKGQEGPVYHFDFYRIKSIQEAYDLGYEEYFYSSYPCLIEWPELIAELLPPNYIRVRLEVLPNEVRKLQFIKI